MEVIALYYNILNKVILLSFLLGCSEYTIIPARYAYLLKTDITDSQASILERKPFISNTL